MATTPQKEKRYAAYRTLKTSAELLSGFQGGKAMGPPRHQGHQGKTNAAKPQRHEDTKKKEEVRKERLDEGD
jgi:hypothetical protein